LRGRQLTFLRNYSNPKESNFGDAQATYSDLCDYFEGGAQARVSAASLETQLTTIRLNGQWTKTVRAFVTKVSHLIRDHKEITKQSHDDKYYIEKLKNTFTEHKDMSSHLRTLETQDAMFTRRFGAMNGVVVTDMTYEQLLFEVYECATTLDERYAKTQRNRRETYRTQGEITATAINGNNGDNENNNEGQENTNQCGQDEESTIPGPPTAVQVNTESRATAPAPTRNQEPTLIPQPGTVFRNMLSQASHRSANATQHAQGDGETVTINGIQYCRVMSH